jgi:hypothetical protein
LRQSQETVYLWGAKPGVEILVRRLAAELLTLTNGYRRLLKSSVKQKETKGTKVPDEKITIGGATGQSPIV